MTTKTTKNTSTEDDFEDVDFEGPFGLCDDEVEQEEPVSDSKKKYQIPGLKAVQKTPGQDTVQENLIRTLGVENTSSVDEKDLDLFIDRVNTTSKEIVNILLSGETEYILALESAASYVKAFLRDCLNVDAVVDDDVMEVISSIGKANIVFHALKKMPLPSVYKAYFFKSFIEDLALKSSETLAVDSKAKRQRTSKARDLEIVLKRLGVGKGSSDSNKDEVAAGTKRSTAAAASFLGSKKSRTT